MKTTLATIAALLLLACQPAAGERAEAASSRDEIAAAPAARAAAPGKEPWRMFEKPSDEELKAKLTPEQYRVTQHEVTEPAFRNEYWDNKAEGIYVDVVSGEPLFSSREKYDSGTGWPSFWEAMDPSKVTLVEDRKLFMRRTEARCARCGAHLGHVFPDGPQPTGERYCMNSASLRLDPDEDAASTT